MTEENRNFEYYFAKVLSYIFHPLLVPVAGVFFINFYFADKLYITDEGRVYLVIITGISTLVLPLAFVPMMLYQKLIKTVEMKTAEERHTPLFIFSVFYFFSWFVFYRLNAPLVYKVFMLTGGFSLLSGLLINYFTKISMHMIGIGGLVGSVYSFMLYSNENLQLLLFILIFVSGIVAYSRLRQNAHTPLQVYLGFFVGFFVAMILFFLYNNNLYL